MSDHEKLTSAITIKLTDLDAYTARQIAASKHMELSEYIRDLIEQDKHMEKARWESLNPIFGKTDQSDKGNKV